MVLVHECLSHNYDTRDTLDARRHAHSDPREEASHGYHTHHGGCYDIGEDQSPSLGLPGPQAFGRYVLHATFPPWYQPPINILKYSRETNPGL